MNSDSTIPDELAGATPEDASSAKIDSIATTALLLLIWAIFSALLAWNIFDAIRQSHYRADLRRDSQEIAATVTKYSWGRGGHAHVSYTFTRDGITYTGSAEVPRYSTMVFHKSDSIEVRYVPSNPSVNHPGAWEWSAYMEMDSYIVGTVLVFAGGALFFSAKRSKPRPSGQ